MCVIKQRNGEMISLGKNRRSRLDSALPCDRNTYQREGAVTQSGWSGYNGMRRASWRQITQEKLFFGRVFAPRKREWRQNWRGGSLEWKTVCEERASMLCGEGMF